MTETRVRGEVASADRGVRHVASALACTTVGVLPSALFGGLAPLIRSDLGFDARWIGVGVALFFLTSSLASVHGGRLAERLGSRRGLWLGVAFSTTALFGIATLAANRGVLALFLAIGGLGNAVTQPAANLALARGVPVRWRGRAFGFKQAAIPTAIALGGFAVPALGVTLGWRSAFLVGGVLAVLAATLPDAAPIAPAPTDGRRPRLSPVPISILFLTGAIALGSGAGNAVGAYLVESSIAGGWSAARAGLLLGAGSVTGILARLTVGWVSDRMSGSWLRLIARMMAVGALGFAALGFPDVPVLLVLGVVVAFAFGWGYNGLFLYAVVRLHPEAPAAATGVTQVGAFGGPVLGPPLFGLVATHWSYQAAWAAVGVMSALAAVLVQLARRQLVRERGA